MGRQDRCYKTPEKTLCADRAETELKETFSPLHWEAEHVRAEVYQELVPLTEWLDFHRGHHEQDDAEASSGSTDQSDSKGEFGPTRNFCNLLTLRWCLR